MRASFDYEVIGNSPFGMVKRPVAKVALSSIRSTNSVLINMIVDSGADFSILPFQYADQLEISIDKDCIKNVTTGIGGSQIVYFYKKRIKIKIGNLTRSVPIAFTGSNATPALLGRLGFLETFDVEFLKSHKVVFKN